ncbi:hypothetical protein Tco_0500416 [Tanacetum coccineum]
MSNSNTNLQTQSSNALHNAIMEAGSKDRPPMLALGSSETTTERYMENYRSNVSHNILYQLNAEAKAVQIILTRIDNDIYSTVDTCPNACEMWKSIERMKQGESIIVQDLETNLYWEFGKFTSWDGESLESYYSRFYKMMNDLVKNQFMLHNHQVNVPFLIQLHPEWQRNRGKAIVTFSAPTYDPEPNTVTEDDEMSKDKEIDKLVALIPLSFKKIYKPTNNNLRTSSKHQTIELIKIISPELTEERVMIIRGQLMFAGLRKMSTSVVQKSVISVTTTRICHVSREKQADWKDDTDDESDDQELEAHYMYMAQLQEVTPDQVDNSGPIFDDEPMHKDDQDDTDDLDQERDLLASLIQKLKCEIDDSKNQNKFLESSNKALVDKLKGEIEDFKTKNKSLESSNNHFKEANNELSKTNQFDVYSP